MTLGLVAARLKVAVPSLVLPLAMMKDSKAGVSIVPGAKQLTLILSRSGH